MIKSITYENIVRTLASFLDNYSGIDPIRILNADSIRGTDISEAISSTEMYSPEASPSFVLFELLEDQNDANFSTKGEEESDMDRIQSYNFHLMIYGNSSPMDAQKISSLFKQPDCALYLRDCGIFISGVDPVEAINEFINNTLLLRRDLIIKLQVRHEFKNVGIDVGYFEEDQQILTVVENVSSYKPN